MESGEMNLHPYLEYGSMPSKNIWYILSGNGKSPSMRVGLTATVIDGKVYFVGGANPNETFADIHELNLENFSWDVLSNDDLEERYEHCAFSYKNNLFIWGGAQANKSLSEMQCFNTDNQEWTIVKCTGTIPSPRTCHGIDCNFNNLYIYSGGYKASEPVEDKNLYEFDPIKKTWSIVKIKGEPPKSRQGHVMLSKDDKCLVLHGGMASNEFFDDLFFMKFDENKWIKIKTTKVQPCKRAAHAGIISNQNLFIFGGMTINNHVLNDLWSFNFESNIWSEIKMDGSPIPARLDMASCLININIEKNLNDNQSYSKETLNSEERKKQSLLLFFGGMDVEGNFFDDCFVCCVD